ncbi:MAG: aminoacyl-tRNA hydrolase [Treponemataceae bacterium]|nr:aminoacyl-tRNA hydrolase [Treponemataceae bacterium]
MQKISLVAFLGNVGDKYRNNRHNSAWLFCDSLPYAGSLVWHEKFKGHYAVHEYDRYGEKEQVFFLKPDTFMNLSGESIQALAAFYKIKPESILVVHDELELPCGTVSLKWSGGLGGHNGLRSTKEMLGTADFWRLRFGIGRPEHKDIAGYVLSDFTADERIILSQIFPQTAELLDKVFVKGPESQLDAWKKKNLAPSVN